jgi:hypothetical protein
MRSLREVEGSGRVVEGVRDVERYSGVGDVGIGAGNVEIGREGGRGLGGTLGL